MNIRLGNFPHLSSKFPPKVVPIPPVAAEGLGEYHSMYPWQQQFFPRQKDEQYFITIAPCGSGKSFYFTVHQVYDVKYAGNWERKQLTIVPQKGIGYNFVGKKKVFPLEFNGEKIIWKVTNLCAKPSTAELREWLLDDASNFLKGQSEYFSYVATHSALVEVWKTLTLEEKKKVVKNLTVYIDECHHLTDTDVLDATRLGMFIGEILDFKEPTLKIRMTTATFFRGDGKKVLTNDHYKLFSRERLEMEEFIATTGIQEFDLKFMHYDKSPLPSVLKNILSEPKCHHLVIVPPLNGNNYRGASTHLDFMEELKDAGLVCMDMVTPSTQGKNWEEFQEDMDKYDVIVACKMFEEGKDWPALNRVHNTSLTESVVVMQQTTGRALRPHHSKKDVKIIIYVSRARFPEVLSDNNLEKIREVYSDRLNIIVSIMLFEDMIESIKVPRLPQLIKARTSSGRIPETYISLWNLLEEDYKEFCEQLVYSYDRCKDQKDPKQREAALMSVVKSYYKGFVQEEISLKDFRDAAYKVLLRRLRPKKEGLDLSILRKSGLENMAILDEEYGSIVFGTQENIIKTFPKYKDQLRKKGFINNNVKNNKEREMQQNLELFSLPRAERVSAKSTYAGRWVNFEVPAKNLKVKTPIGFIETHNDGCCMIRIYPSKTLMVKGGKVLLNGKLILRDTGYWAPYLMPSQFSHTSERLKKKFIKDSDVSKTITISTDLVKSII